MDNQLTRHLVLRALCSNANGLLWTSDTAHTISVGSSFSISTLKSFQWNIEVGFSQNNSCMRI